MREILFRAQSAKTKEWVYGDLIHTPEGKHRIIGFVDTSFDGVFNYKDFNHLVLPTTVGQYTGLKDKEGNKIFEGDKICDEDYPESSVQVFWSEEHCAFMVDQSFDQDKSSSYFLSTELKTSRYIVVATIHDTQN